jgi:hypothetical protein
VPSTPAEAATAITDAAAATVAAVVAATPAAVAAAVDAPAAAAVEAPVAAPVAAPPAPPLAPAAASGAANEGAVAHIATKRAKAIFFIVNSFFDISKVKTNVYPKWHHTLF